MIAGARAGVAPVVGTGRAVERRASDEAASRALAALNRPGEALLGRADDGRPLWPDGVTGSVSHGTGVAVAVACAVDARFDGRRLGLGVDVEGRRALPADDAAVVLSAEELASLAADGPDDPTVMWAAKEAAFKAWSHAADGLEDVDPLDISVRLVPHLSTGGWRLDATACHALGASLGAAGIEVVARGRIRVDERIVVLAGVGVDPVEQRLATPGVPGRDRRACHHRGTPEHPC